MHGLACKQGGKGLGRPVWIYAGLARKEGNRTPGPSSVMCHDDGGC